MLLDLFETLLDAGEALDCSTCAGNPPPFVPTTTGAAGSAGGSGGDTSPPREERTWPWEDDFQWPWDPPADTPTHERDHHEEWSQAENAADTAVDLGTELGSEWAKRTGWLPKSALDGLGKVLGPLTTVASGAEPLADGISAIRDSGGRGLGGGSQNAKDVAEYMPEQDHPVYRDRPESASDGGAEEAATDDGGSSGRTTEERRGEYRQETQDTLDDIEFKQQMRDEESRRFSDTFGGR